MRRWLTTMLLALLCMMLIASAAAEDMGLKITWKGNVKGYEANELCVTSPMDGQLFLLVSDKYGEYLHWMVEVSAGENVLTWYGTGDNEERIPDGTYMLTATLQYAGGEISGQQKITFERCANAILFALPYDDVLYLGSDDWFAETCTIRKGTLMMDVVNADAPEKVLYSRKYDIKGGDPYKLSWDGKAGKDDLVPGDYILRYYVDKNPEWVKEIQLTIAEGTRPVPELQVTGDYLPAWNDTDEAVWALMQKPSAVIDIRFVAHQNVYAQPDQSSDVLGTLHGRSQCVDVKDIRSDGWTLIGAWGHEEGQYMEGYVPTNRLKIVAPNDAYGLLLDKATQRMAIFHQGKRIAEIPVSTGLMAKNKLFRETPAGSYLTVEHMEPFSMDGKKFAHVIRYDGGNLIHQVPYKLQSGNKLFDQYTAQLGQKASNGCIRIPRDAGESGINAYWLWTHLPYHTRLIILDDPDIRQAQKAAVQGGRDPLSITSRVEAHMPEPLAEGETELVITLGGDAVLGTRESWQDKTEAFPAYIQRSGVDYPFGGIKRIFEADDMTFVNLECVLKENKRGEDKDKLYRFRGLPAYTDILKAASIEQVNIANNHHIDYGTAGKESTRAALENAGIPYSGYGSYHVWEKGGWRIGFAGCRETTYKQNRQIIAQDAERLRAQGCDVIIYSCHWGTEYSAGHNALQEEMAQAAAAAGVDIIVGTHPHVVQGVSTVEDTLVLWSLGNLMFGGTHDMTTFDGTLAQLRLRFDDAGYKGCTLKLIPILTSTSADIGLNDFRPVVAQGEDRERILGKIQADSGIVLTEKMYFPAGT